MDFLVCMTVFVQTADISFVHLNFILQIRMIFKFSGFADSMQYKPCCFLGYVNFTGQLTR